MEAYDNPSLRDSVLSGVLTDQLVDRLGCKASLVLTPNVDGYGWSAAVVGKDDGTTLAEAGDLDPVDAIDKVVTRMSRVCFISVSEDVYGASED